LPSADLNDSGKNTQYFTTFYHQIPFFTTFVDKSRLLTRKEGPFLGISMHYLQVCYEKFPMKKSYLGM